MLLELLGGKFGHTLLPTEVVWQAVLGVTYHYFVGNLPADTYDQYCTFLRVRTYDCRAAWIELQ